MPFATLPQYNIGTLIYSKNHIYFIFLINIIKIYYRCAVLYCFQSYLYHNEISQANLVLTLLPSSSEVSSLTSGQILCGGLFSSDILSNWFASVCLMHGLIDNTGQKEQLLRVLLATNIGSAPVSLLHQCTLLL